MTLVAAIVLSGLQGGETAWLEDLDAAVRASREQRRILLIVFGDERELSRRTVKALAEPLSAKRSENFIKLRLPVESPAGDDLGIRWAPTVVLLRPSESEVQDGLTEGDRRGLATLREKKCTVGLSNAPLEALIRYLSDKTGLRFALDSSVAQDPPSVDLRVKDETAEVVLLQGLKSVECGFLVSDGVVTIARETALRALSRKYSLRTAKLGMLAGLPVGTLPEEVVAELLLQRVSLEAREKSWRDLAALLNAEIKRELIEADARLPEKVSIVCERLPLRSLLDLLCGQHRVCWYPVDGKIRIAREPDLVALDEMRLADFFYRHVEYDEATLPAPVVQDVLRLSGALSSDSIQEREVAAKSLVDLMRRIPTTRKAVRRAVESAKDSEVRSRLEAALESAKQPS